MTQYSKTAYPWLYEGLWGMLVRWFQVPETPPALPADDGEGIKTFRPSHEYVNYQRVLFVLSHVFAAPFVFMLLALIIAGGFFIGPILAILLILLFLMLIAGLVLLEYVGVYLRYDATWYLVGERSLCVRQGVWVIRETIVPYDNVQNVSITQGPLQRSFGIFDVRVETAGTAVSGGKNESAQASGAVLAGLDNPEEVKALIQAQIGRAHV